MSQIMLQNRYFMEMEAEQEAEQQAADEPLPPQAVQAIIDSGLAQPGGNERLHLHLHVHKHHQHHHYHHRDLQPVPQEPATIQQHEMDNRYLQPVRKGPAALQQELDLTPTMQAFLWLGIVSVAVVAVGALIGAPAAKAVHKSVLATLRPARK
ncbi:hypothetical protein GPECTOR_10g761 [Gonium pectorale]|uniref:Uncharacterized protein n=1 Tax=Gonium pectorale TaxID=33097 RepID=A0A150GQW2_GONPE|nr:hypothetical protein GPECTOR_10g761 [Gonium pectorale]|eukprot:KXZ52132.1 hypothetical protein GPECTOR_10g761 [Gonium pectorale]